MKSFIRINFIVFLLFLMFKIIGCSGSTVYTPNEIKESSLSYLDVIHKFREAIENKNWARRHADSSLSHYSIMKITITEKSFTVKSYNYEYITFKYSDFDIPNIDEYSGISSRIYGTYLIQIKGFDFWWNKNDYNYAKQFLNALYTLKYKKYISLTEEINKFEDVAKQYRNLNPKPEITEEVRKLIVQATSFTKDKNYIKAIESYEKAIEVDQTYPEAHFNISLILAQVEDYEFAAFEMKKYLLLVPDASDARSAQDQIYEWEAKIEK